MLSRMQTATTNRRLKHTINHAVAQCYGKKKEWRADNFHPDFVREQEVISQMNRSYKGSQVGGVTFRGSTDYTHLETNNSPVTRRMEQVSMANTYIDPDKNFQHLPPDRWMHP